MIVNGIRGGKFLRRRVSGDCESEMAGAVVLVLVGAQDPEKGLDVDHVPGTEIAKVAANLGGEG